MRNIKGDLKLTGGSTKDERRKGENMKTANKWQHFDPRKQAINRRERGRDRSKSKKGEVKSWPGDQR